jgi:hypothetical protein
MCQEIGLIFRLVMDSAKKKQLRLLNHRAKAWLVDLQQGILRPDLRVDLKALLLVWVDMVVDLRVDLKALLLVWVDMVVDQWVDLKALLLALVDPVMCQDIGLIFRLAMDFLRQKQLLLLNRRGRVYLVGVQ